MFTISAFADEISPDPQQQIDVLKECGVRHIEFRSILGTNVLVSTATSATDPGTPVYDVPGWLWAEPKTQFQDPPFSVAAGGGFKFTCEWNNTTGKQMTFGMEMCVAFAQTIRKTAVSCAEVPGFVVNRILMSGAAEIWRAQEESGKAPQEVDQKIQESKALPMGPFFLADMTGLDTTLHVAQNMVESYGERFHVHAGMKELVEQKNFGQKTGKGFYEHND